MMLAVLLSPNIDMEKVKKIVTLNKAIGKDYRNPDVKKPLIELLSRLVVLQRDIDLRFVDHKTVFENIVKILGEGKDSKSILPKLQKIQTILDLGKIQLFEASDLNLDAIYAMAEKEIANILKLDPGQYEACKVVFNKYRDPRFLTMWAARLNTIENPEDKRAVLEALHEFVVSVMTEGPVNRKMRYDMSNPESLKHRHLHQVFATRPELFQEWCKGASVKFNEFVTEQHLRPNITKTDFLKTFLARPECQTLKIAIPTDAKEKETLKNQLIERKKQKPPPSEANLISLKLLMINFTDDNLVDGDPNTIGQMKQMLSLIESMDESEGKKMTEEWKSKISEMEGIAKPSKYEGWTIVDTDHAEDISMMGNEVNDSCQAMHREAKYTKCLLGTQLDGKHRLIAVKNKEGAIVCRALMRILIHKETNTPVLFMEKVYENHTSDPLVNQALDSMFKSRAQKLGPPLASWNPKEDKATPATHNPVVSRGGRGPHEYVDALNGVHPSVYEIPHCRIRFDPASRKTNG